MKVWQAPFKKVSGVSHKNITKEMLTSLWLNRKADFVSKLLKKIRTAENSFLDRSKTNPPLPTLMSLLYNLCLTEENSIKLEANN